MSYRTFLDDRCYVFRTEPCEDDPELLAQGRFEENAQKKRAYNRLPRHVSIEDAKERFAKGQVNPEWVTVGEKVEGCKLLRYRLPDIGYSHGPRV